jgi:DNA invertase Pin-like site-specific DNA recombinase
MRCGGEEYCRHCFEILQRFYEQGESAKTTERSELRDLLKSCRMHKSNFVVVYSLTRSHLINGPPESDSLPRPDRSTLRD